MAAAGGLLQKLRRPKEHAADWVWIIDHTIQLGVQKCLVILGVRLSALPPPGTCLRHEHVEPLTVYPVQTSNGEVVYQQLTAAVAHTGVPQFVRTQGLSRGWPQMLEQTLGPLVRTERGRQMGQRLLAFVQTDSSKVAPQERLLGSSEIIESVFDTLKRLEQHHAHSGFTGLLLAVGAMVSTTTQDVIQKALETVPTRQVRQWCQQHLGPSVQAQRHQAFRQLKPAEEKQPQFQQAA